MTIKRDGRGRRRDYKKEYKRDHKPKKDRADRASRGRAALKVKCKKKGKEVDHIDGNPRNNARSNLKCVSRKKNSSKSNKARRKKKS
jgi:hypothetical protein